MGLKDETTLKIMIGDIFINIFFSQTRLKVLVTFNSRYYYEYDLYHKQMDRDDQGVIFTLISISWYTFYHLNTCMSCLTTSIGVP